MMIRFIAIFYFILMAIKHSKYQGDKKDKYTYLTFVFLAISQTFHNLVFLPYYIRTIISFVYYKEPDKFRAVNSFFVDNKELLEIIESIMRLGIAYQL